MNPLQDLKDIRPPAAIENWPPAYGWWILAVLAIAAIVLTILWIIKVRRDTLAKRHALKSLQQIDCSDKTCLPQLNQLLKRVAMVYFPQQNVQKMHGENWTSFLINTLPKNKAKDVSGPFKSMQQSLYQPSASEDLDIIGLQKSVKTWISHALPPKKATLSKWEQQNA